MKPKVAIVRGKFLNKYEMQYFEPLTQTFDITAFGSLTPFHDKFTFPVQKLPSPMDLPNFPYKMPFLNRLFIDAHYLWDLEEKLKGFDLVHTAETYFHYTQQCLNAKKKGFVKKVIATVLENIPFNNEGIWGRKAFKARARRELDHIIALTKQAKHALIQEGADEKKITVLGDFVDTKRFRPVLQKPKKQVTVLFVGRLVEEKGVFDILKAAKLLKNDGVHVQWRFVGEGSAKSEMLRAEKQYGLDAVHTISTYEDIPEEYQKADIFVAPSKPTATWQEQYGIALLEAQASGLPIVTTRSGAIPENVGGAALLVGPGDVLALASSLKQFILNPKIRKEYSAKARKRAIEVHDIAIGAKKISRLYQNVLKSI